MDKMKKFIDIYIPVTTCNLRCEYCYITQNGLFANELPKFKYSPEYIAKALSKERLGGPCHLNMCGGGETLLPIELIEIIRKLLEEGHYIFIVTNGLLTERFNEIIKFPTDLLERLGFKFSFHYKELKKINKMNVFFENIKKIRKAGCSFTVELTPHDGIIGDIDSIKEICMKEVGALCHVTVARLHDVKKDIPILTKYSKEEYKNIWGQFKSDFFDFKMSIFNKKRTEFCYAGAWSYNLDLGTGELKQCYASNFSQNIYKDINAPLKEVAIGRCKQPHCYNGHVFLTTGLIPELKTPTYAKMRNRRCTDDSEWLNFKMKSFLSSKLIESNQKYSLDKKRKIIRANSLFLILNIPLKIKKKLFSKIKVIFKDGK